MTEWIPMEPQPEGDVREAFSDADFPNIEYSLGYWMYEDAEFRNCDSEFHPPHQLGDKIDGATVTKIEAKQNDRFDTCPYCISKCNCDNSIWGWIITKEQKTDD